jgi:hypothetical protein
MTDDQTDFTNVNFEEALGTLVQHLFPNGCPGGWNNEADYAMLMCRRQTRALVSSDQALKSLKILQRHSHGGFTTDQQQTLVMAACATLDPTALNSNLIIGDTAWPNDDDDGDDDDDDDDDDGANNSRLFRNLIQMILPQGGHPISQSVILKLLSTCQKEAKQRDIITVLQFLALAARKGALTNEARRALTSMHPLIFNWVMEPSLCMDAVRLLIAITQRKHARLYRTKRLLQHVLLVQKSDSQWPILLLLQLYLQLDSQGFGHVLSQLKLKGRDLKAYARRLAFPSPPWERSFHRAWHAAKDKKPIVEPDINSYLPQRLLSLDNASHANPAQAFLQQEQEQEQRYRICLPFVLQQEWYSSNPTSKRGIRIQEDMDMEQDDVHGGGTAASLATATHKSQSTEWRARRRMLDSLSIGSLRMDSAVDATLALSRDILPAWDGTEDWGVALCYDIVPVLPATTSFAELWSKTLVFLEKLFINGSPKLQYAIVSGILTPMLGQLARRCANDAGQRSVKEFIHWAQQLLQESLISRSAWDSSLLSEAAMNFFHIVGTEVTQNCSLLVLPNSTWAHRFLLSASPFATDRGWQLLVVYLTSLKALTARQGGRDGASGNMIVDGLDRYARIGVYLCIALCLDL